MPVNEQQNWNAAELVRKRGHALVGRRVDTQPYGFWSGGVCTVIKIAPDPAAPEIVFYVRRESDGEEIGVFDLEIVRLCR